jgi:hypothetical protein
MPTPRQRESAYPTDDAMHDGSAELIARRYAAAVAFGMIADDLVDAIAAKLSVPPEALRESPLLAISLAQSPAGKRQ